MGADDAISLLVVDDEERMRSFLSTELVRRGFIVDEVGSGEEAIERAKLRVYHVVLLDLRLPGMTGLEALSKLKALNPAPEVVMITGHGTIDTAIEAMRLGAYHYVTKPFKLRELELHVRKAHEKVALTRKSRRLERLVNTGVREPVIVGRSAAIQKVLSLIQRVGPTDSTVLISGESGTGKELVANGVHHASNRAGSPIVPINCGTLQENLLESELFGHEKGSFTGAHQTRLGLFEVAQHGTLFLDEVGEMSTSLQVKLLRVLQENEIRRLGSDRVIPIDVRVIAATNINLREAVGTGEFREDLYYRLNVLPIEVPPLRERREDIPDLVLHFLRTLSVPGKGPFSITEDALDAMVEYPWPGNVRELANMVERMMILADGEELGLREARRETLAAAPLPSLDRTDPELPLAELERMHILSVLRHTDGNKTRAAQLLGISTRTLYNKLAEYKKTAPETA